MLRKLGMTVLFLYAVALTLGVVCNPCKAHAEMVPRLYVGSHVAFINGGNAEMELGGSASASLSPHISAVASAYHGLEHNYWVPRAGFRVTATDANNRKFSVGIGLEYQLKGSEQAGPKEWCSVASVGYRPWDGYADNGKPKKLDPLVLVAQGSYGNSSQIARTLVGARWAFNF